MGAVEDLYRKSQVFDSLFKTVVVVIETNDYSEEEEDYIKYYLTVESTVNVIYEEITAKVTLLDVAITDTIYRFFRSDIPPQRIKTPLALPLFTEDAEELLFTDDWNNEYPELLFDAIEDTMPYVKVRDVNGKSIRYFFNIREMYLDE
ncbi:hypothetical protein JOD43_004316 [Pullulanibacillus pueri]|uniref:Uncharacterized protein n=1 Tax=Pullulanibacillus pueri TaxID=1437324 RepID=A0A8J2ZZR1_9BACL|nr:hypothetical protein [Pullulanibacillus pueri]MBM7684103.1 hypothetical protein [Pullulanibacillus pueri]GGH88663.1 hypothetical protein GCM10007096_41510 [Pullulanibacillus pueri]